MTLMMAQNNSYFLFIHLSGNIYHILPSQSVSQEENMALLKTGKRYVVNSFVLGDNSRFKTIMISSSPAYVATQLEKVLDLKAYHQEFNLNVLDRDIKDYTYRLYWTHTFLDGARVFPILIHPHLPLFYNLSPLFPQYIKENSFGLIVPFDNDGPKRELLCLQDKYLPGIIEYFSYWRMCHCCGIVSNFKKPRINPWYIVEHDLKQYRFKGRSRKVKP